MTTIQQLFDKMTAVGQPRVAYGIYWAINKMAKSGTKCSGSDGVYTFTQWVSYKDAEFILPKLQGFDQMNGYKTALTYIGEDRVVVRYYRGGINGNVRIDIDICDVAEMKKNADAKKIDEENKRLANEKEREMHNRKFQVAVHLVRKHRELGRELNHDETRNEIIEVFGEDAFCLWMD